MLKQKSKQHQKLENERVELEVFSKDQPAGPPVALMSVMENIPLIITVELGRTVITLKDLRSLRQGQVLALDQIIGEPLCIFANGQRFGIGEVVGAGKDQYGIRITALSDERPADEGD